MATRDRRPDPDRDAIPVRWIPLLRSEAGRFARAYRLDADAVFAEMCLAVVARFPTYDPARGTFGTWAAWVARSGPRRAARARTRRHRERPVDPGPPGATDPLDPVTAASDPKAVDPLDAVTGAEARDRLTARVREALARLKPVDRAAVERRFGLAPAAGSRRSRDKAALARGLKALEHLL